MDRRQNLLAFVAGSACLAADAALLHEYEIEGATGAELRVAYLECDRISAASRVDQDFMVTCARIAERLRDRDFEGDFERQLEWWRSAREPGRLAAAPGLLEADSRP